MSEEPVVSVPLLGDVTAETRRKLMAEVPAQLEAAIAAGEKVWTSTEMQDEFRVVGYMAPLVVVERRSDGVAGTLMFVHSPRYYFGWEEDRPLQ